MEKLRTLVCVTHSVFNLLMRIIMKIKNIHILAAYNNQVILVNNNGVLELPGTKLKVTHNSEKGAVKDFMKIVVKDLSQENIKIKEKNAKKMLKNFKSDVVSKNKDLVLSSKAKKAFEATNEMAQILFTGGPVYVAVSELKQSLSNPSTQYQGSLLSKEAREAIQKAVKAHHI
jgi:hypothetical protein